jgi:pyruvate dehydrogenase E1 component alpha subunit/2-oxoisovalerate dehydrogenase E1 component alpha subunit
MRRYPAYDPPEYVQLSADPALLEEYAQRLEANPERAAIVTELSEDDLLGLYRHLLRTRLHDIALKRWVRTGVISKAWLGTGEEAVTVGGVGALDRERDVVCPMIRNAGALHMMGMPLADMLRGYLATADSPSGGRDLHIGDLDIGVLQPVSQMGTNVQIMAGIALAFKRSGEGRVAMTWAGDGATRTAAFHEGINFAAVQDVPLVLTLQNNQVALGTRLEQHGPGRIERIPDAYGLPMEQADGNNLLDVFAATRLATDRCRAGEGPVVVVAETFRMGGHATHDEREARATFPAELFEEWGRRDPVGLYEEHLVSRGVERTRLEAVEDEVVREMDEAAEEALSSWERLPEGEQALYEGFSEGSPLVGLEGRPVPWKGAGRG